MSMAQKRFQDARLRQSEDQQYNRPGEDQRERDAASARKVFKVAELLEKILLDVDMVTLLLAQRVDKTFKATIDGSSKLLKKLWLLPDSSSTGEKEVNPLLGNDGTKQVGPFRRLWFPSTAKSLSVLLHWELLRRPGGSWERMQMARTAESNSPLRILHRVHGDTRLWVPNWTRKYEHTVTAGEVRNAIMREERIKFPDIFDDDGNVLQYI